jgi:hypothetical protein
MPRRRSKRASARLRPGGHMFTTCCLKTILNVVRPASYEAAVKVDGIRSGTKSNEGVLEDRAPFTYHVVSIKPLLSDNSFYI